MKIYICDDDPKICEILETKVRTMYPAASVKIFASGGLLLDEKELPDILLLDIKMPDPDGMEVASILRARGFTKPLIFITGEDNQVFNAFDVQAFHYLLKPVSDERFREVMKRAVINLQQFREEKRDRSIEIQSGGDHIMIQISDIVFAEVFDRKIVLHNTKDVLEFYGRLSVLEKQLGKDFFRVHRSFVIHLKYVRKYDRHSVTMEDGTNISISRDKYEDFLKAYMEYNREEALK